MLLAPSELVFTGYNLHNAHATNTKELIHRVDDETERRGIVRRETVKRDFSTLAAIQINPGSVTATLVTDAH